MATGDQAAPSATTWLGAGTHFLTITGRGSISGIAARRLGVKIGTAQMLPTGFQPAEQSMVIEAEEPAAEEAPAEGEKKE